MADGLLSRPQLASVQMLRAVAALLVVAVHAIGLQGQTPAGGPFAPAGEALFANHSGLRDIGASGVDLFFVISGFIMAHVLCGIGEKPGACSAFLRARALRILPMFWLASAAYMALVWWLGRDFTQSSLWASGLILPVEQYAGYHPPVLFVGWSLAFELTFYGLVAASISLAPSRRLPAIVMTLLLMALTGWVFSPPGGMGTVLANPIHLEFLLGIGVWRLWRGGGSQGLDDRRIGHLLIAIAVLALMAVMISGIPAAMELLPVVEGDSGLMRAALFGLPYAALLLGLLLRERSAMPHRRAGEKHRAETLLLALGASSYALYLCHMFVMELAAEWLPGGLLPPDLQWLALVAVAAALGHIVHLRIERPLTARLSAALAALSSRRKEPDHAPDAAAYPDVPIAGGRRRSA